jgi:N-methylhydantoinase B
MSHTTSGAAAAVDPIALQVYRHRFTGVAEEMGVTLRRTAYSPNIKERLDFSCALFDGEGRMISQAAHIPAHLGAMPASVATILATFSQWDEGDVVIVNDPFQGGNHLPDITMITPVFAGGQRASFFVASRAHHAIRRASSSRRSSSTAAACSTSRRWI